MSESSDFHPFVAADITWKWGITDHHFATNLIMSKILFSSSRNCVHRSVWFTVLNVSYFFGQAVEEFNLLNREDAIS